MIEPADVRRRLVQRIKTVREEAAVRRASVGEAQRDYEQFLETHAVPVFRSLASGLRAEGLPFQVFTPAGTVRLASERSKDDYIEIALDTLVHPVQVVGRVSYSRGSRLVSGDQPLREGAAVRDLTGEHVLDFVLRVIGPFVER